MRFVLTIIIWVVILGGLWSYSRQRQIAEAGIVRQTLTVVEVQELYTLQLTPTFSIEPDPFALQTADSNDGAVELRLNGITIPVAADSLQRGTPWTLKKVDGLVEGTNEIYVQASPPITESQLEHGVRVQLLKGEVAAVDSTLWSRQGSLVSGTIHFELKGKDDQHDH
jgi:hypothetical protein